MNYTHTICTLILLVVIYTGCQPDQIKQSLIRGIHSLKILHKISNFHKIVLCKYTYFTYNILKSNLNILSIKIHFWKKNVLDLATNVTSVIAEAKRNYHSEKNILHRIQVYNLKEGKGTLQVQRVILYHGSFKSSQRKCAGSHFYKIIIANI